jgi:hypothetical protein
MLPLVNYLINTKKETDNILVYLHVQKCGGTTLQRIIESQYQYDKWLRRVEEKKQRNNVVVFKGHFEYGEENQFLKPEIPRTYITMLREPVDRVVSTFYYVRRVKKMRLHKEFNKITFLDFLQNDEDFHHYFRHTNMMTRLLSGGDPDDLNSALKNLEEFDYVGLVEEFNKSLEMFSKALGWKVPEYKNKNVTKNRPTVEDLTDKELKIINEKNRNDRVLYLKAKELFWEQYNRVVSR